MIQIRSWFSDWKEVSFEKAYVFYRGMRSRGAVLNTTFHKHFRGVTIEDFESVRQRNGLQAKRSCSRTKEDEVVKRPSV